MTDPIHLYNIYYGNLAQRGDRSRDTIEIIDYFTSFIGKSSWFKVLSSYFQIDARGEVKFASGTATRKESISIFPTITGDISLEITTQDIQTIIVDLIKSNRLPKDPDGIYTLIFDGKYRTPGWLTTGCSTHSAFILPSDGNDEEEDQDEEEGTIIKYIVLNDPSTALDPSAHLCSLSHTVSDDWISPNRNVGADSIVSFYAHELMEVVTDYLGSWHFPADENGIALEIGDACAWDFGILHTNNSNIRLGDRSFLVQQIWQPGVGCVLGRKE